MRKFLQYSAAIAVAASGALIACSETTAPSANWLVAEGETEFTATVGTTIQTGPAVRVLDETQRPLPGVAVTFGPSPSKVVVSGADGIARFGPWQMDTLQGRYVIEARLVVSAQPALSVTFNAFALPGPVAHLIDIGGNNQAGLPETTLPRQLDARATDIYNNPVRGIAVTFSTGSGGGSIEHSTSTTDSSGVATAGRWTLGTASTQQVIARSGDFQAVFYAVVCATSQQCDDMGPVASRCTTTTACFAFARSGAVFTTSLGDSPPQRVLENATRPSWSPDGGSIAFTRPNTYHLAKWQVCIAGSDGSRVRCVTSAYDGIVDGSPSWSADGMFVAFSANSSVLLLDTRTMDVKSIGTLKVKSVSWSPDGKRIAFSDWGSGLFGHGALYSMNPDGSDLRLIASSFGNTYSVEAIAWSPDGKRLALALTNENACPWYCDTALGVANADGSGLQVLDTAHTVFQSNDLDWYISSPAWSADGQRISYTTSGACDESEAGCRTEIRARALSGGDSYVLVPNAAAGSWRP